MGIRFVFAEPGFEMFAEKKTGIFKDKAGRRYRLQEGKRVPLGESGSAAKKPTLKAKAPVKPAAKLKGDTNNPIDSVKHGLEEASLFKQSQGGLMDLPLVYSQAKQKMPDLTKEQFHQALLEMEKNNEVELHGLNEEDKAKQPELGIRRGSHGGKLLYYAMKGRGKPPVKESAPAAKPPVKSDDAKGEIIKEMGSPKQESPAKSPVAPALPKLDLSKVPNSPKEINQAAQSTLQKFEEAKKAHPLPPKVEAASQQFVKEQLPGVGDKIMEAVSKAGIATGHAAVYVAKNTARLVGGTLLAGAGLASGTLGVTAGLAVGGLAVSAASAMFGPLAYVGGEMTGMFKGAVELGIGLASPFMQLGAECFKGSGSLFSKLGQFAENEPGGDQALPMDQVKEIAQSILDDLRGKWLEQLKSLKGE